MRENRKGKYIFALELCSYFILCCVLLPISRYHEGEGEGEYITYGANVMAQMSRATVGSRDAV